MQALSRDQRRSRRKRETRSSTINTWKISNLERAVEQVRYPQEEIDYNQSIRPRTRADCQSVPRPCPWVGCRHNLYLDVTDIGTIKLNFPDLEPGEMVNSCAMDIAEELELGHEEIGEILNITREQARKTETVAIQSAARSKYSAHLKEHCDESAGRKRVYLRLVDSERDEWSGEYCGPVSELEELEHVETHEDNFARAKRVGQ